MPDENATIMKITEERPLSKIIILKVWYRSDIGKCLLMYARESVSQLVTLPSFI